MRATVGKLSLVVCLLAACGDGGDHAEVTRAEATRDGGVVAGCATDVDCPVGMLCEACPDGARSCVPGCRTDAQCGANLICVHDVQCLSCPCPSGWCDLDPCRDLDGDGWAAAPLGTDCGARRSGDCDDAAASAHPGGVERCANGRDDDCDGERDGRDDECQASCGSSAFCGTSLNCGPQRTCDRGCCATCPQTTDPTCAADQCLLPGGLDARGCLAPSVCGACVSCPQSYAPVCGRNFATYLNACLALAAGTTVMHDAECDPGEGITCLETTDCAYQQLCRDIAGGRRCARVGTCTVDSDCDVVTAVASCGDAGAARWVCREERCAAWCQG